MISRRLFIAGTATTAAATTGLFWLGNQHYKTTGKGLIKTALGKPFDELLESLNASEKIAIAWLESLTQAPTQNELVEHFANLQGLDQQSLEQRLTQAIQTDFLQGNFCQLDGWQLSLTECRLAALRYLSLPAESQRHDQLAEASESTADTYTEGEIAPLKNWGDQSTLQGQKFNVQPDGHSGLWFQFEGAPAHAKITIDGEIVRTVISDKVVTSGLFERMQERILSTPGLYEIALIDPVRKIKQTIGNFEVKADLRGTFLRGERETLFCAATAWGPEQTQVGVAANEQPDGSMGVWVQTPCFPEGGQLMFVEDLLKTTIREFGVTATIPLALLGVPGEHPLYFYDVETEQKSLIGHILLREP